jgi:Lon protease-like protein
MFRRYVTTGDLADIIPVFPLTGVVLLPRGSLPLNIFEPRYLKMVDDAMRGNRLIGMIQPRQHERLDNTPPLYEIGGVGRIISYSETDDARFHISLSGLCRFRIAEEMAVTTPYRQVRADYSPFAIDLAEPDDQLEEPQRNQLVSLLKDYFEARRLDADWDSIKRAPSEHLINALAMICPFQPLEKQALLEALSLKDRADALIALIAMAGPDAPSSEENGGPLQ